MTGLTSGGLIFILYLFIFSRPAPKTQSTHERALELVSGGNCWRNLHDFSSRSPSQGSQDPPWAPKGPKIGRKSGAGFIILSCIRSAHIYVYIYKYIYIYIYVYIHVCSPSLGGGAAPQTHWPVPGSAELRGPRTNLRIWPAISKSY